MKKIYFVLTYTGTILSKLVHVYTGQEFCHSSLSLDEGLTEMYSFGRYWAYNPFIGGLIKEEVDSGTFKRFHNTKAAIYSLEVTDWQYKKIKKEIKRMLNSKEKYTFNTLGLAAVVFDKKLKRKNKYYCSEFVKHLVEVGQVENNLPDIARPQDFENIDNVELIYKGKLKDFRQVELA